MCALGWIAIILLLIMIILAIINDVVADTTLIEVIKMYKMKKFLGRFLKHLTTKYNTPIAHRDYPDRVKAIQKLTGRYNPDNIVAVDPYNLLGLTSFVMDKGGVFGICLRREDGGLHQDDIIKFVIIHELGHLAIDSIEHTPKFWRVFKWLLNEAEMHGYIKNENVVIGTKYCNGIVITSNPFYNDMINDF